MGLDDYYILMIVAREMEDLVVSKKASKPQTHNWYT
jgi:hypothetical protein